MAAKQSGEELPRDVSQVLDEIEDALKVDRGFTGEDIGAGPDMFRGSYGNYGPFAVTVNRTSEGSEVIVSATSQSELFRCEVLAAYARTVAAKDTPDNQIVIISCGLPDKQGYICPYDHAIFLTLQKAVQDKVELLPRPPAHICGVLVHLWDTDQLIAWGEGSGSPWGNGGSHPRSD
jgi:hypothetical protein